MFFRQEKTKQNIFDQGDYRGLPEPVEHCNGHGGHKKSDHGKEESPKCP